MGKEKFDEIDRRIERLLRSHEEFRKEMKELKEAQKKTDDQIKKTDEHIKKTDEHIKKIDEHIKKTDEQIRKTDEQIRKTDEQIRKTDEELRAMFKKTDEEFDKIKKLVVGISDGWGRLTEGFAIASVEKILKSRGIILEDISVRRKRRKDGDCLEIDLLSIGKENGRRVVVAIEVKTYLTVKDVKETLYDLEKFYDFFEEYRALGLIGGIAFMNTSMNAKVYAEKQGLYLFSLGEDVMMLANSKDFKPKVYKYNKL